MARLSATLKGNDSHFYNIWQPFLYYLSTDIASLLQKGQLDIVLTKRTHNTK